MKCLAVDTFHHSLRSLLEDLGIELNYQPNITKEEVEMCIQDYDILMIRSKLFIDKTFLNKASKLTIICRAGAGLDFIDQDAVKQKNIHLFSAPTANRDTVGEHTVGMILSLLNKINLVDKQIRQGIWKREENRGNRADG